MVVRFIVGNGKADRDFVEESRIAQINPGFAEIVAGAKHKLVLANLKVIALKQRRIGAAVGIRGDRRQFFEPGAQRV